MNKKILKHIIRYILMILIVLLCIRIFNLSAQNGDKSSDTSHNTTKKIIVLFDKDINNNELENKVLHYDSVVRKTAHCAIYAVLGFLLMCTMITYKNSILRKISFSILYAFLYACSDEWHQVFVPGRSGKVIDIFIDTSGALIGIIIVLFIFIIVRKIMSKKKNTDNKENKSKVLFIASTGGHLNELLQLKPLFSQYEYNIITEKTEVDKSIKEQYGSKMKFLIYGTKKYPIRYLFKFTANCFISLFYYMRFGPDIIVTTGTHTAVPMCYIGKMFGSKIIYIETFANRTTGTLTGKIIYPIADTFVIQWEELKSVYSKAKYWGWIY